MQEAISANIKRNDALTIEHLDLIAPDILRINLRRILEGDDFSLSKLPRRDRALIEVWDILEVPWDLRNEAHQLKLATVLGIIEKDSK